jgi:hypothetical protein
MINLIDNQGNLINNERLSADKKHPLLRTLFESYSLDFGRIKVMYPNAVRVVINFNDKRLDIAL